MELPGNTSAYSIALGQALVVLRERKRLSQAALANLVGISQPTLSRFERGVGQPDAITLRRLAESLEISIEDLNAHIDQALELARQASEAAMTPQEDAKGREWWQVAIAVVGVVALAGFIGYAIAWVFKEIGKKA